MPTGLTFEQTDQYDPNPRPRIKLREWHLTAKTEGKKRQIDFVTLYHPHRLADRTSVRASLEQIEGGYLLKARMPSGEFSALLPTSEKITMTADGLESKGKIKCRLEKTNEPVQIIELDE
jgi:hypothetical protein